MPIGTDDGQQYENGFEAKIDRVRPVYITKPDHPDFEDRSGMSPVGSMAAGVTPDTLMQKVQDVYKYGPMMGGPERGARANADENQVPESGMSRDLGSGSLQTPQTPDYDYESWQKANPGVQMAPGQHYPDTYKLPNHITFSDESQYHGQNGEQGGHWDKNDEGKWSFTPGPSNLKYHSMSEMRDYFKRVEPDATLNPPNIEDVPHHDWIEDTLKGIYHAIQAPGEAFQGKLDPMSEEGAKRVAELGMTMVGGPSGMVGKEVTLGSGAVKYHGYYPTADAFAAKMKDKYGEGKHWITQATDTEYKTYNDLIDYDKLVQKKMDEYKEGANTGPTRAWFKGDTQTIPKDVAKYQKYIDMFKQAGHNVKEAVQTAVDTHNSQFANMRGKFMTDLQNSMVTARDKGYDTPAFRGLNVWKDEGAAASIHDFNKSGGPMYSSNSPMLADMYAGYLNQHPGYHIPEGTFPPGAQVMPLVINTKDYHYYDAKGGHWTEHNSKAIKEAKKEGKVGVIVDRVSDEPNSTNTIAPKKVFITFPKGAGTVKSRFAKEFDPTSPDMLKGIGAIGIGTAATGYVATSDGSESQ